MKSGLEGRNNKAKSTTSSGVVNCLNEVRPRRPEQSSRSHETAAVSVVSMKSGLEGRNNHGRPTGVGPGDDVSMKSGLEGRNNRLQPRRDHQQDQSLNEVRPRRPEQCKGGKITKRIKENVSMKSGLEGRNNRTAGKPGRRRRPRLNEVRTRRPEQSASATLT